MDGNPWTLIKTLAPRLPHILYLSLANRLNYSPASDKQNAMTEIVVSIIKSMLKVTRPLSALQSFGLKDPGVKGATWVSTARCPAPGEEVGDALMRAVRELGDGREEVVVPELVDVEGEWTGHREGCKGKNEPMPALGGDEERYRALLTDCTTDTVVLYSHGGAHFMMDPISHRPLTASLARKTGGRVFSLRYRLSPQNPFPCALLDAFTAYLYLLAPPPGAFHQPVKPSNIVFAGDSAGGQLSFSLLVLLLTLRQARIQTVRFHGVDVPLDLPGGIACNSPWLDISRAAPSITTNAKYDYIDPPGPTGLFMREIPPDDIWPVKPPRAEIFCTASLMTHPLVSPITTPSELWSDCPPVWMCCGSEGLTDEIVLMAKRLHEAGVITHLVGYEGMPHCFALLFQSSPLTKDCIARWTEFIAAAAAAGPDRVERMDVALWARPKRVPPVWDRVPLEEMGIKYEDLRARMDEFKANALAREQDLRKDYEKIKADRAKL